MSIFNRRPKDQCASLEALFEDYELPTFPGAINDVLGKIRDDDSSNSDIAQDLESDPAMTVRILGLVNSAGFGLRHRVDDVSQAVQLVGRSSLESILISLAMKQVLPTKKRPGFDPSDFWRTSTQRAAIAGRIAAQSSPADRSLCWTAAMLQDVAIPMLVDHLGDRYCAVMASARESHEPLVSLEREEFGFDHAEVGQRICADWNLPERLANMIADHHAPPTLDTAAYRVVAFIGLGPQGDDDEPAGVSEMIEAATSAGLDPDATKDQIQGGLEDATDMNGLL